MLLFITLGLMYTGLAPILAMPLYNRLLFFPMTEGNFDVASISNLPVEHVRFNSKNNNELYGWYVKKPGATKTVLLSHGNGGNILHRQWLIEILLATGASVLVYDYGGYGLSKGQPTMPNICDDGLGAFDYLVNEKQVAPENIVLMGESIGTGVACQIASKRKCGALILHSGYTSIRDLGRSKLMILRMYPNFLFPEQMLDSASRLRQGHPPLLMLHGANDTLIPIGNAKSLFDQAAGPHKTWVTLPNAGHNDMTEADGQLYGHSIMAFLHAK